MHGVSKAGASEEEFAQLVSALAADPKQRPQLLGLLREGHPVYDQRSRAAIIRMRGWVLIALARSEVPEAALPFVLEELESGVDAYLVAAAARALRSCSSPSSALAPYAMRAISNIRYRDELVSFEAYGEYDSSSKGTSAVGELLEALAWLGPQAREVLPEVEALRERPGGLPANLRHDVDRTLEAIRAGEPADAEPLDRCCRLPIGLGNMFSWALGARRSCQAVEQTVFEDHDGSSVTFSEFFGGSTSIVVFFYTRCDNPLKCSLTVAKLARVQKLLQERQLGGRIKTAAVTYDPAFDLPKRLRRYGEERAALLNENHRVLRAVKGFQALCGHFKLGFNSIGSLVNRHQIEAYILDPEGRIASSFERLAWDEHRLVDQAVDVMSEKGGRASREISPKPTAPSAALRTASSALGTMASLGVAFFPKCPVCWAAYASLFGIAGLEQIPYTPWLQPVLATAMLVNLAALWLRGRSTGRMSGCYLAGAGAFAILVSKAGLQWQSAAPLGVALTFIGSLLSALNPKSSRLAQA